MAVIITPPSVITYFSDSQEQCRFVLSFALWVATAQTMWLPIMEDTTIFTLVLLHVSTTVVRTARYRSLVWHQHCICSVFIIESVDSICRDSATYDNLKNSKLIIELVDSTCRDSTDTQYMIIKSLEISWNGKLISLYNNVDSVFEESMVNIYWGHLWGLIYCSVLDGKLQLKQAPASKIVT